MVLESLCLEDAMAIGLWKRVCGWDWLGPSCSPMPLSGPLAQLGPEELPAVWNPPLLWVEPERLAVVQIGGSI